MEIRIATKPYLVESEKSGWYVYVSVRDYRTGKLRNKKIRRGFKQLQTVEEKRKWGNVLIQEYTKKIKKGWVPWEDKASIYEDEINYQNENLRYSKLRKSTSTIRRVLSDFLSDKKLSLKKKTYATYQSKLRVFNKFIDDNKYSKYDIGLINNDIIQQFFRYLIEGKGLDRRSIKNYKVVLSMYFIYAIKRKLIIVNPVYDIPRGRKIRDATPAPIIPTDLKLLFTRIEKEDPQLYLACLMQYFCAIRPGEELQSLKIKDINFWNQTIHVASVYAKTSLSRTISIPEQLYSIMMEKYRLHCYDKEFYVFSKTRKPGPDKIGINTLRVRFNAFRDALGLSKDYKFYSCKHTGAGMLIEKGGLNIKDLQEHFGHLDVNSTIEYLKKFRGTTREKIRHNFPDPFEGFNACKI